MYVTNVSLLDDDGDEDEKLDALTLEARRETRARGAARPPKSQTIKLRFFCLSSRPQAC